MKRIMFITALLLSLTAINAEAKMGFKKKFTAQYPKSSLSGCVTCHNNEDEPGDSGLNAYGEDLNAASLNFKAIEAKDSDGDGKSNLDEINAGTLPGDKSSL